MTKKERKRITKEITLHFYKIDDQLIFDDQRTLSQAMGTKGIAGNLGVYGIEKKGNEFYVKLATIKERLEKKKRELQKLQDYIDVMEKIVKAAEEKT